MLKELLNALKNEYLPYFWNSNKNMLEGINSDDLIKKSIRLEKILTEIEENKRFAKYFCKYFLTKCKCRPVEPRIMRATLKNKFFLLQTSYYYCIAYRSFTVLK